MFLYFVFLIFSLVIAAATLFIVKASLFQLSPPLYLKFTYLNAIALIFLNSCGCKNSLEQQFFFHMTH